MAEPQGFGDGGVHSQDAALGQNDQSSSSGGVLQLDGSIKTYDNFFQELEKDFGQMPQFPSPPHGMDSDRDGQRDYVNQSNAPYTSTLEHKHNTNNSSSNRNKTPYSKNPDLSSFDRHSKKVLNERKPQGRTSFSSQSNCSSLRSDSHYSGSYHSQSGRQNSFNTRIYSQPNTHHPISSPSQNHHEVRNDNSPLTSSSKILRNNHMPQDSPQSRAVKPQHTSGQDPHQQHGNNNNNNDVNNNKSDNNNNKNQTPAILKLTSPNSHGQDRLNQNSQMRLVQPTLNNTDRLSENAQHTFNNLAANVHLFPGNDLDQVDKGLRSDCANNWPRKMDSKGVESIHRWPESNYSYSDNEKQLLEEMRRMKKEHQNVLRTYEGRINKLMAKMHELRSIAEMLENSSTKSSPFGVLPGKLALLNILGDGGEDDGMKGHKMETGGRLQAEPHIPPPLPPRPVRGSRVYPNKPIIHTNVTMKNLLWDRIILDNFNPSDVLWKDLVETDMDKEELERLFSGVEDGGNAGVNLYEDICQGRGPLQMQPVHFYETEHSQRIHSELCNLKCNLEDVTRAFLTLNPGDLHIDSFAELLELLNSHRDIEKVIHHGKKKGASQLDVPEFLVFELSKIDHFKERLEFLRFKNKLQINLFEIDQQLKELHIACDEICSSLPLKHVLATVLSVGNYMNGGTDKGQADGYNIEILTSLKYLQDKNKRGNLLELIMKIYCQKYESDREFGCPTHFRLPEPSNMRHAAQVSFEDIQRALKELKDELTFVMNKLENLSKRQTSITLSLRVTSENFFTSAVEVLAEEQKLLEDTKIHFNKTTTFFNHSDHTTTPKEFFQLWASFLHDCKYYWKLAHRNLARSKFTEDIAMKNQMSSSSLPGFNNLKSVMMKHVATFQREDEMDESKAQQLQHISSWIESVGRYAMEMQPPPLPPQPQEMVAEPPISRPSQITERSINPSQHFHSPQNLTLQSGQQHQIHHHHHHANHQRSQQHSPPYVNSAMYWSQKQNLRNQPDLIPPAMHSSSNLKDSASSHMTSQQEYHRELPPSSPKPLSAVPPNVIKPLPISHVSPTISSPSPSSPTFLGIANPMPFVSPQPREMVNEESEDNFGFSSPQQLDLRPDLTPEVLIPDKSMGIQSPTSPTGTNSKKNQNFFKAFLKKDQKKSSSHQHHHHPRQDNGNSPQMSKVVVTPFNKLKNTFVQKLSGSGSSKKSDVKSEGSGNRVAPLAGNDDNNRQMVRSPIRFPEYESSPGQANNNGIGLDNGKKNASAPDYQNYPPQSVDDKHFESDRNVLTDRGESVASTMSTISRYQDQVSSMYGFTHQSSNDLRNSMEKLDNMEDSKSPYSPSYGHKKSEESPSTSSKSGSARLRVPIALGSNISISEVFGSAADSARDQSRETPERVAVEPQMSQLHVGHLRAPRVTAIPSGSDPKLVRAEAVPVYKAKLIPNYENQTKLDPRVDNGGIGIKGQAEAVRGPLKATTTEKYKMELQKQSEKYLSGGSSYANQGAQGTYSRSGTLNNLPNAPTTYTVMPPKSNHYHMSSLHASPFIAQHPDYNTFYPNNQDHHRHSHHQNQIHQNSSPAPEPLENQAAFNINNNRNRDSGETPNLKDQTLLFQQDLKQPNRDKPQSSSGSASLEKSSKSDTGRAQGRRSNSAHNLLSGNLRHPEQQRTEQVVPKGHHVSRRDASEIKVTPTSRRALSQGRQEVPSEKKVTSLIDKFEGRPLNDPHGTVGLLDVNEKPPSMTSTPVSKRKNLSTKSSPFDVNGNISASTSDAGSHRSRTHHPENRKEGHTQKSLGIQNEHLPSFGSPSQIVSPFNTQSQGGIPSQEASQFRDNDDNQEIPNSGWSEDAQIAFSGKQKSSSLERGWQKQEMAQEHHRSAFSRHENIPCTQSSLSSGRQMDQLSQAEQDQDGNSGQSRPAQSNAELSNHNSHRHRHRAPSGQQPLSGATSNANFQSPNFPKPESSTYSRSQQQQQHHHHSQRLQPVMASSQQNLSMIPSNSNPVTVASVASTSQQSHQQQFKHEPNSHFHPVSQSLSNSDKQHQSQHQQQAQPQHPLNQEPLPPGYHSWPSSSSSSVSQQQQQPHSSSRSKRETTGAAQHGDGTANYSQQLRKTYQSHTSAFERPLKPTHPTASAGQKNNTAIVKPTVMHL